MDHTDVIRMKHDVAIEKMMELGVKLPRHWRKRIDSGWAKRALVHSDMQRMVTERARDGEALPGGPFTRPLESAQVIGYKTGSGNTLSLSISGVVLPREEIPLMTEYETLSSCGNCAGSNGGCPGYAPLFENLHRSIDHVFVIVLHVDIAWAAKYATPHVGWKKGKILRQLMYTDRMTDMYMKRLRKAMLSYSGGHSLSMGNCEGCMSRKECSVVSSGEPCIHPNRRTFSVESVGVDVDELHFMLYGEYLPWYYKGTNRMPTYMSRYLLFFCEPHVNYHRLLETSVREDKSYCEISEVPELVKPNASLLKVPSGVHCGYSQYVYD